MVTEELHSIAFETQICLYGLTIELEVGFTKVMNNGEGEHPFDPLLTVTVKLKE